MLPSAQTYCSSRKDDAGSCAEPVKQFIILDRDVHFLIKDRSFHTTILRCHDLYISCKLTCFGARKHRDCSNRRKQIRQKKAINQAHYFIVQCRQLSMIPDDHPRQRGQNKTQIQEYKTCFLQPASEWLIRCSTAYRPFSLSSFSGLRISRRGRQICRWIFRISGCLCHTHARSEGSVSVLLDHRNPTASCRLTVVARGRSVQLFRLVTW